MTYEQLQMPGLGNTESIRKRSHYCRPDFRVSLIHLQEKALAMVTSVTYGERLQDVSEKLSRDGSSVKIRRVCFQGRINGTLIEYCAILPKWGTVCRGEYGELVTSERLISENEYSFLPTPTASEGLAYTKIAKNDVQTCVWCQHHAAERGKKSGHAKRLIEYLAYLKTPLNHIVNLHEMIMGFPLGWTDSDVSVMR